MPAPSSPDPQTVPPPNSSVVVGAVRFRQLCPGLRIFDLFWIAVDLQKLILAASAVFLLWGGNWCFLQLPFATPGAIDPQPAPLTFGSTDANTFGPWQQAADFHAPLDTELRSWSRGLIPLDAVNRPAQVLFRTDATWPQLAMAWTRLLWALGVWAIFGGAITRIAAVQIGTDRKTHLWDALRFSARRLLSFFSAPLIPLSGVGVLWLLCLLAGLVGRIPNAGPWIVGAGWGIALVFGFLMALILIGLAAGWPLMFATISVEGTDAPDGLTRSYGYVFARPVYYAALVLIVSIGGTVATYLVSKLAELAASLALWGVAWGMGNGGIFENQLTAIWLGVLATFVVAFAQSYFWSAATMIYFLLRRSVDANPFSEVYLEEDLRDEMLPWAVDDPGSPAEPAPLTPLTSSSGDAPAEADSAP